MTPNIIYKQANFVEQIKSSLGDQIKSMDFKNHPFRTIFEIGLPAIVIKSGHPILSIFFALADSVGLGGSKIGDMIDAALGIGQGTSISESSMMTAASDVVSSVMSNFREGLSSNDGVFAMATISKRAIIIKTSRGRARGLFLDLFRTVKSIGGGSGKFSVISMLFDLIKMFVVGLLLKSGIGAVSKSFSKQPVAGVNRYKNEGGVEKTIISFLNDVIKSSDGNFSDLFYKIKKTQVIGSSELNSLLSEIEKLNSASLFQIDERDEFLAPSPVEMAKKLLPQMQYEQEPEKGGPVTQKSMPTTSGVGRIPNVFEQILGGA